MPHEAEIQEARETISKLEEARSSIQSVLSGNRSLLNEARYGSLVSRADSLTERLAGAIDSARSFIENNQGSHPDPQPPEDPAPEPPGQPTPPGPIDPPRLPAPTPRPGPGPGDPSRPVQLLGTVEVRGSH